MEVLSVSYIVKFDTTYSRTIVYTTYMEKDPILENTVAII